MDLQQEIQRVQTAVSNFDKALGAYQKDSSGANKKLVIEKHKIASNIINGSSSEIRGEISESWSKVDLCMRGFASSSGGLTNVMTFGQSGKNANTQIDMIRGAVAATLKALRALGATTIVNAAPAPVANTAPIVEEATVVEESVAEEATAVEESVAEEATAVEESVVEEETPVVEESVADEAPAVEESAQEDAPIVEEPIVEQAPAETKAPSKKVVKKVVKKVRKKTVKKKEAEKPEKIRRGGGALPIIGFWLGFLSFASPLFGLTLAIVGLIFSIIGIKRHASMAVPGLIINIFVIFVKLILPFIVAAVLILAPLAIFAIVAILGIIISVLGTILTVLSSVLMA